MKESDRLYTGFREFIPKDKYKEYDNEYLSRKRHTKKFKLFVSFYIRGKRYRLYNGRRAGIDLNPNSFPESKRIEIGKVLAYKIYEKINSGGTLTAFKSMDIITGELSDLEYAKRALNKKLTENYSDKYKMMLKLAFKMLVKASNSDGGIAFKSLELHLNNTGQTPLITP